MKKLLRYISKTLYGFYIKLKPNVMFKDEESKVDEIIKEVEKMDQDLQLLIESYEQLIKINNTYDIE